MSKLMQYLGMDVAKAKRVLEQNGGIRGSLYSLYRQGFIKEGTYIGTDAHGNKYYENKEYYIGRSRWVIYSPKFGTDFDGSMVAPEWFGWLHYKTDEYPTEPSLAVPKYVDTKIPHSYMSFASQPDKNQADLPYMPYSTTKPKVQAWTPPKAA